MSLPADSHVHSEWSWDSPNGSMERTCAQAAELGLPAVAFTDHMDFTVWKIAANDLEGFEHLKAYITPDWALHPRRWM
jgi:histidinol-phosphatase (PHP family)